MCGVKLIKYPGIFPEDLKYSLEYFLMRNFLKVNSFITTLGSWFQNLGNEVNLFCDFSKDCLKLNY